jgi:hypothetical protein
MMALQAPVQLSATRTLLALLLIVGAVVVLMIAAYAVWGLNGLAAPSLNFVTDPANGIVH